MPLKQKDIPPEFCKQHCCAWRGDRCQQFNAGPGGCLWTKKLMEDAKRGGLNNATRL